MQTKEIRKRPLHILHMAHIRWFNAEVQYALDLALEMKRRGDNVLFFGQTHSPGIMKARGSALKIFEECGFNAKGLRSVSAVAAILRLHKLLREERFDAVEIHRPEGLPLIAWACWKAGVPAVRVRGDMRPPRTDPLNRFVHLQLLSGVVSSNSAIEKMVRQKFGDSINSKTIHGGVDHRRFTPHGATVDLRRELGFPENSFLVGILGRLGEVKGHDDFLEGARIALERGASARFVILAKEQNTHREKELRDRVEADSLLRDNVAFLGWCEDLPNVLRSFDAGVVASTGSEANCRVGLEWMASGVPLIASKIGVLPDLINEGENGFLIPPRAPSSLADKIVYLADSTPAPLGRRIDKGAGEAARMGREARNLVLNNFTIERCAREHDIFIREAILKKSEMGFSTFR